MTGTSKKILDSYQCEINRKTEENFASLLSERDDLRLFFVNEDQAFTDGVNIVVDPAVDELFCDSEALYNTEDYLGLAHEVSQDKYKALQMITRCQNIHETLHIIYTAFPLFCASDKRATDKFRGMLLSSISNIIEDAFIEAAGVSEFDGCMRTHLKKERYSVRLRSFRRKATKRKIKSNCLWSISTFL